MRYEVRHETPGAFYLRLRRLVSPGTIADMIRSGDLLSCLIVSPRSPVPVEHVMVRVRVGGSQSSRAGDTTDHCVRACSPCAISANENATAANRGVFGVPDLSIPETAGP